MTNMLTRWAALAALAYIGGLILLNPPIHPAVRMRYTIWRVEWDPTTWVHVDEAVPAARAAIIREHDYQITPAEAAALAGAR